MSAPVDELDERNRRALARKLPLIARLRAVRPTSLSSPLLAALSERRIVAAEGLRIFADPTTHLGFSLLADGGYEPETVRQFRANLRSGDTFLDIGANEGFFTALGAALVGPDGCVVAVEPQSRLAGPLEINARMNARGRLELVRRVIGTEDDALVELTLFPISNTGASSLVRRYGFGARTERVRTVTVPTLLRRLGLERVDFAKVDVEGFEPEVVESMKPVLRRHAIKRLLLDYHRSILERRRIDPLSVHASIVGLGYAAVEGDPAGGYVLYRAPDA